MFFKTVKIDGRIDKIDIVPTQIFPVKVENHYVLPARVLGIDYVDYIRLINGLFDKEASVELEDNMLRVYWKTGINASLMVKLLNARMEWALGIREEKEYE